ncbi:Holliday junction DNA helicase RuvA [Methylocella silvestris BL2]|uniref:Holliday junction branch migration complex subunit RuvA n=1 Tax=Methylocella silvestris (strain DSM 15510 / CIP 108128 / LMG 27833 / NCIMB 13906 / BL2) TaxID=395965 RepID=RUVA_METSB|nr:Holliday junction branch migration protein RuvA [Methylocella silvestris]B8EJI5.1 RecName: Full=Holliday junction branch migration complex subunit RuvA [Methylocella silvestris BL2]ACK48988.1 Holliday junction DNA helicase RuvA [Methylocella silvestris BL2]
MIGKLKGLVDSQGEDYVILDVNGVGYVVHCSSRTLQNLPPQGQATALAIDTQMREDSIKLYGFASETEREWFRLLQSVQGVGAKVALAIQGVLRPGEIVTAIAAQDRAAFARASGVGAKLAARILAELKDKAPALGASLHTLAGAGSEGAGVEAPASGAVSDAISVLVNLGFGRSQAAVAVAASSKALGSGAGAGDLAKRALQELAQSG